MAEVVSNIVEVSVFRFLSDHPEFLLLRRAPFESLYPGIWQIITGSLRESETALQGAGREVLEEIGVAPIRFWVVPHVSAFYDAGVDRISLIPHFAAQLTPEAEVVLSHEHDLYEWVEFREARKRVVWPAQMQALEIVYEQILGGERAAGLLEVPFPSVP
jgi:8-oxo-dGTP pyrophosphatase MutT (NUDIX family)